MIGWIKRLFTRKYGPKRAFYYRTTDNPKKLKWVKGRGLKFKWNTTHLVVTMPVSGEEQGLLRSELLSYKKQLACDPPPNMGGEGY